MVLISDHIGSYQNIALVVETRQKDNEDWKTCKNIGAERKITCDDGSTSARYVRVRSMGKCELTFKEFEVYV